jgi:polysaccharide pyruvyl transferase WcaK-like protein
MSSNEQFQIGLLGASFETQNMGVGALAAGAIKCILKQFPNASVFLLDYARERSNHALALDGKEVAVPLVNMRFSKKFYLANNIFVLLLIAVVLKIIPSEKGRNWLATRNSCLRKICQADLFASISGGDSLSDIYGIGRLLYVSLPQILIILLGKKLVLLPQTLGPFRGKLSQIIAKYILRCAERVYVRDYRSLRALHGFLGHQNLPDKYGFRYDVAFVLDPLAPSCLNVVGLSLEKKCQTSLIGLNISGLLFMGGYTRNNAFGLLTGYKGLVYDLIDFLISKKDASILLVPHVFGTQEGSESDLLVCERVFASLREKYPGRLGLLQGSYDQSEIKYVIGLCDFFIGSRMHACIAAISQHVPAVAIAYSDKFMGVMETIGVGSLVADARELQKEEIVNMIGQCYESRAVTRRHLETKMSQIKVSVLDLFNGVPIGLAETSVIGN